ncbi:MAG TPA: hypothetical protein VFE15_09365 [Marmoricola sp.]|nr:hypothetical protein [Marmoricola sp.]
MRRLVVLLAVVILGVGVSGCQHVPKDASKQAFCSAGEKFSELDKATFAQGRSAIKRLADVGTPPNIDSSARAGFVELVDRMQSAHNAEDFRHRTRTMSSSQRKHLLALDSYIQKTCTSTIG